MRLNMINKIKKILKNKWYREIEDKDITINELKQLQKDGAIVIDVRSPQEYREGHIDQEEEVKKHRKY